jgi:hypothetical protein
VVVYGIALFSERDGYIILYMAIYSFDVDFYSDLQCDTLQFI